MFNQSLPAVVQSLKVVVRDCFCDNADLSVNATDCSQASWWQRAFTRLLNTYIALMLWVWGLVLGYWLWLCCIVKNVLLMQHAHLPWFVSCIERHLGNGSVQIMRRGGMASWETQFRSTGSDVLLQGFFGKQNELADLNRHVWASAHVTKNCSCYGKR